LKPKPDLISLLNRIAAALSPAQPDRSAALRDRLEALLRDAGIAAADARRIARAAYPTDDHEDKPPIEPTEDDDP